MNLFLNPPCWGRWVWRVLGSCGWVALLVWTSMAQVLRGQVVNAAGAPLAGVHVAFADLQQGTITTAAGTFAFDALAVGSYTLVFTFVGYRSLEYPVTLGADDVILRIALEEEVIAGEEVEVTGERADRDMLTYARQAVTVLSARALEENRGQTFGETLAALPGVNVLETGPSIAKPVVRGLHSARVLVLNAGLAQEGQQWGGEHAPEIDPFSPARIEVIKGAAGVEYGIGAIGGVIRVEPRALPQVGGFGGQVLLNGFSNNRQGAGSLFLEGGIPRQNRHIGWRVQGSFRKAGDAQAPDYVIANSAFNEQSGSATFGLRAQRWGLEAMVSHFGTTLGIYRGAHINNIADLLRAIERGEPTERPSLSYDIAPPKQDIRHDVVSLKTDYRLPEGHQLEAQYGIQWNQRQEFDAHRAADAAAAFDLRLTTQTLDLKFKHQPTSYFFGTVGIHGMNQGNRNEQNGYLIPNFRALTGGVFGHETWISGPWTVSAGLRFDYRWLQAWPYDNSTRTFVRTIHTYRNVTAVIGSIFRFAEAWSAALNVGSGWRPPSVNELYSDGVHHGTAQYETGDPNLMSERSFDLSLTLRHASERAEVEFSVYNNRIENFISLLPAAHPRVTIRGVFPAFQYIQSAARLQGIDGFADVTVWNSLHAHASVSLVRANQIGSATPIYGMPADRFTLGARWTLPDVGRFQNMYLDLKSTWVLRQDRVPPNTDYAPPPAGYTLLDVRYGTEIPLTNTTLTFSLSIENMLNIAYRDYLSRFRYFIDNPGRNIVLRLQVPFGSLGS